jgi:hypothetical protein
MNAAIWVLMVQASLGAFNTLYYHEYKLKLPSGEHATHGLRLHHPERFCRGRQGQKAARR